MSWLAAFESGLALVAGAYVALALAVTVLQRKLIYQPDVRRTTPAAAGHSGVDVWNIPTPDGEILVAWYAKAAPGRPTVLYFHGNTGYLELRNTRLAELQARGFGVLMPSYRGYGGSTGDPSETALVADAKLLYDTLRGAGVAASDIVAFGESLGTGVATQLAASKRVLGLALDSPYTSMADLAALTYRWLPVRALLWDHFDGAHFIKRVIVPILILHGENDALVPVGMAHALASAAVAPVTVVTFPGATHLEHLHHGSFDDFDRWVSALHAQTKRPRTRPGLHQKTQLRLVR